MYSTSATLLLAAALAGTGVAARAQTMIDTAAVMAGNVTPGDAPGFPLQLNTPGHYVLKGNLEIGSNLQAVNINASNVTLDLNGFSIMAPGQCSQAAGSLVVTCNMALVPDGVLSSRSGIYVDVAARNVHIRNGTVQGFRGHGIIGGSVIENMRVRDNRYYGIYADNGDQEPLRLIGSTVWENGSAGVMASLAFVERSMVVRNGHHGLWGRGMTVNHSVVSSNREWGIVSWGDMPAVVRGSTVVGNRSGVISGTVSAGGNFNGSSAF